MDTPSGAGTRTSSAWWVGSALAVAALTFAVYLPALEAELVNFDDDYAVRFNGHIQSLSGKNLRWMLSESWMGHWTPLAWLSLALNYRVHGLAPFGYHLVNVLLHALNAALCFLVLRRLLPRASATAARLSERLLLLACALGALLFSVHPLRVESVAWVTERRDALSGAFWLLALLLYLRACEPRSAGATGAVRAAARALPYGLSLACFALSLLSKAWGITLPLGLLMLDIWPLRRLTRVGWGRLLLEKLPYALLAGAAAWKAAHAQADSEAMVTLDIHPPFARLLQACHGLCFYAWKTLWPADLHCAYLLVPHEVVLESLRFALPLALVALVTLVLVLFARRWPAGLVSWLWFALTASPVLGFAQSGLQIAADRYTYLACLPAAALYAGACLWLAARRRAWLALAGAPLIALALLSARQCAYWKNSRNLWEHVLSIEPDNYYALVKRGHVHEFDKDYKSALASYERATRSAPEVALAWFNRGNANRQLGNKAGAMEDYDRALSINPNHVRTLLNRGALLGEFKLYPQALANLDRALQLAPNNIEARMNRGCVLWFAGNAAGAVEDLRRGLEQTPPDWPNRAQFQRVYEQALQHSGG